MSKKIKAISLMIAAACSFGMLGACKPPSANVVDKTKTQLRVSSYDGGIGQDWLYAAAARFEQTYADHSFEDGKTGVQVIIQPDDGGRVPASIKNSNYNVFFYENLSYLDYISKGEFLDITDIVTEDLANNEGSIEDKLTEAQQGALKVNGKYYCLPHYEVLPSLSYDRDLFKQKKLFIKEGGGYTGDVSEGSVGPNGIRGDYDDGLPSSYEEFWSLCDRMLQVGVIPFIHMAGSYSALFSDAVMVNYLGESANVNWTFDSGDKTVEIVTGFDGDNNPITEQKTISPSTGYLTREEAAEYWAIWNYEKMLSKSAYRHSDSLEGTVSHLDAQRKFIYSKLEGGAEKPIAMIIEGSYWWNEAQAAYKDSVQNFNGAENRDFSIMPLPWKAKGTVKEGEGRKNVMVDHLYAYAFLNANLENNPDIKTCAKLFLQSCYTNEGLQEFTMNTSGSVYRGLKYDLTEEQYNSLDLYSKNLHDIRKASTIVYPYSASKIYMNDQNSFKFLYENYWTTSAYGTIISAVGTQKKSAREVFEAMKIGETTWTDTYSKYFN